MKPRIPQAYDMYEACLAAMGQLGSTCHIGAIHKQTISILKLPAAVLAIRHGKRNESRVYYNLRWTLSNLKLIGFVKSHGRGYYSLTEKGYHISSNSELHKQVTQARSGGKKFKKAKHSTTKTQVEQVSAVSRDGADRLLNCLKNLNKNGLELEQVIVALLEATKEYRNIKTTPITNDGGIDIRADYLDDWSGVEERVVIQVKNYADKKIGNAEIRDLRGGAKQTERCWCITTSDFTKDAREEATPIDGKKPVKLTTGLELARLLVRHNVGLRYIFPIEEEQDTK